MVDSVNLFADLPHALLDAADALLQFGQPGDDGAVVVAGANLPGEVTHFLVPARQVLLQHHALGVQLTGTLLVLPAGLREDCLQQAGVAADALDLFNDEPFDLRGRNGLGRAGVPASLLGAGADVVAVALGPVVPGGMGRRHAAVARYAAHQPFEERAELVADRGAARTAVALQKGLHPLPDAGVDDGGVLPVMDLVLVANLADVGDVGEELVQVGPCERLAAALLPLARRPALVQPPEPL